MEFILQYVLYLVRWQMSSPILAIFMAGTVAFLGKKPIKWPTKSEWIGAIIANFVGSNIFIWIDKIILK